MTPETSQFLFELLVGVVLGGLIGWQREATHKPAGLRTHILIVLGATVVMGLSGSLGAALGGDPTRIGANIVVGIGFLGAGTIMKEGPTVHGLTSAATIWVDGALGMLIGTHRYQGAAALTVFTVIVLALFGRLEGLARGRWILQRYTVEGADPDRIIPLVRSAQLVPQEEIHMRFEESRFTITFSARGTRGRQDALLRELRALGHVVEVRSK